MNILCPGCRMPLSLEGFYVMRTPEWWTCRELICCPRGRVPRRPLKGLLG
ncbi:MAG: hypothetical protein M3416_01425 [Acidobacteriota bacterium]|nr:hypothetical protein [Acidobacteriota bacterium]